MSEAKARKRFAIIDPGTKILMSGNLIADYYASGFGAGQAVSGILYGR